MKKYIIIIISFFCIFSKGNAFFGGPSELDMFKNIDSGIEDLEDKMLLYEAHGGIMETGLLKEINEIAKLKKEKVCLDETKDISEKDFEDIVFKTNIKLLTEYINEDCKNNGIFPTKIIEDYLYYFKKHYEDSKKTAENKSDKIYNLSKIGLFSDGILENSGFDLITDIEEIDKIIFASNTDYYGEQNVDLGKSINGLLSGIKQSGYDTMNYGKDNTDFGNKLTLSKYKPSLYKTDLGNNINIDNTKNQYICSQDNNGLSNENLNYLFNDINKKKTLADNEKLEFRYPEYGLDNNSIYTEENSKNNYANSNITQVNSIGGYSKVRDNTEWPCESFFCINIDFIIYEHNLFGSSENITVQYLINRSNEHLSKFASTSMIPAKMSTNLFEIGLKDLNLTDIFHMAIEVTTKPIPILRLEKIGNKDETEFASKNLIEKYYESYGLDYKRRNDIVLLNSSEQEKQSIINSQGLNTRNANEKNQEYGEYIKNKEKGIRIMEKAIEKKVSYGVMDTFVEQYTELDRFTNSIYHYVENLHTIITKMREIPIDKG